MRQVTEQTHNILRALFQLEKTYDFFGKRKKKICELLNLIKESGEPAVIPDILYLIFSRNSEVSQVAVEVIDNLLNSLSSKDLIWFDQYFRQRTAGWSFYDSEWSNLKPSKITLISKFPGFQLSILALLSFHGNGYIREESVRRLNMIDNGREIPFILLRLNDWVDQVREQAVKVIESRLTKRHAKFLLSNIYLIASLSRFGRYDHSSYINAVYSLLRNGELHSTVKQVLLSDDIYTRRECYKIVLQSDEPYLSEIVKQGVGDSDVVVRNYVIKSLDRLAHKDLQKKYLELLENDPFMPNRREILSLYIKLFPEISDDKLNNAIFDPHQSIRHDARYYISKKTETNFAEIYRKAIINPDHNKLTGAIRGLGETGDAKDTNLISNYAHDRIAKIRKTTIRAIAKLSAEDFRDLFISLIKDDSPRVSKEAALALLQCNYQIVIPTLWDIFEKNDKNHILKNILFILSKLTKWESIIYYICALKNENQSIKEIADVYLDNWLHNFNRSFTTPTIAQKEKIEELLKSYGKETGDNRLEVVEFNLKSYQP